MDPRDAVGLYVEVWQKDIHMFLKLIETLPIIDSPERPIVYTLWTCKQFFEAVENDEWWYLFGKNSKLATYFDEKFDEKFQKYIDNEKYEEKIKAREIWDTIKSLIEQHNTPQLHDRNIFNPVNTIFRISRPDSK